MSADQESQHVNYDNLAGGYHRRYQSSPMPGVQAALLQLSAGAEQHLQATRDHWGIENSLHWVLDVAFNEDRSRVRKEHAPVNLAVLRHMAVNLLQQEKTAKGGVKAKRLQAALDESFLLKVLTG